MITRQNQFQSSNEDGYIQVFNQGAFMAYFFLRYYVNGQFMQLTTSSFPVFQNRKLMIPANATEVIFTVEIALYWDSWLGIYGEKFDYAPKACYLLTGITLDAHCDKIQCPMGNNGINNGNIPSNCCCCCCCKSK